MISPSCSSALAMKTVFEGDAGDVADGLDVFGTLITDVRPFDFMLVCEVGDVKGQYLRLLT